jgi:hypothetical protein
LVDAHASVARRQAEQRAGAPPLQYFPDKGILKCTQAAPRFARCNSLTRDSGRIKYRRHQHFRSPSAFGRWIIRLQELSGELSGVQTITARNTCRATALVAWLEARHVPHGVFLTPRFAGCNSPARNEDELSIKRNFLVGNSV